MMRSMNGSTRLGERLTELDLTAAWLARQVDVHRVTAARWVNGEIAMSEEHARAVASVEILGLSVDDLSHDSRR